jgi:hypothetical protein
MLKKCEKRFLLRAPAQIASQVHPTLTVSIYGVGVWIMLSAKLWPGRDLEILNATPSGVNRTSLQSRNPAIGYAANRHSRHASQPHTTLLHSWLVRPIHSFGQATTWRS